MAVKGITGGHTAEFWVKAFGRLGGDEAAQKAAINKAVKVANSRKKK